MDGTLPGYQLRCGYGSGLNSQLIHLEVCKAKRSFISVHQHIQYEISLIVIISTWFPKLLLLVCNLFLFLSMVTITQIMMCLYKDLWMIL